MIDKTGYFVVSLDFESMWGAIGSKDVKGFEKRTRFEYEIVDGLIERFTQHNIHTTWGIVGALTCKTKEEMISLLEQDIFYKEWNVGVQDIIRKSNKYYYLKNQIETLSNTPNVEIASHTFSHAYVNSESISKSDIRNELELSKNVLSKYGTVSTIIFPRNQINKSTIQLLKEHGYSIYRGTINRLWNNKYLEYLNCYIPLTRKVSYSLKTIKEIDGVYNIPASLFLRFNKNNIVFFDKLKVSRIKHEMKKSAKKHLVFHLWFHPHNLGNNVKDSFKMLDDILSFYDVLKKKYGYESVNMIELKEKIARRRNQNNESF